jgi:nucleoside-diphosphate-sugar epimerase
MALAVVTGVAGFVGSTLAERLVDDGWDVRGVDCFTPYYDRGTKEANLARLRHEAGFALVEADLRTAPMDPLVDGADVVFHQAAQPGVRLSWSEAFADYDSHNVLATQRLLEAVKRAGVRRLVFASSSSVYGNAARFPTSEDDVPCPHSPYGVTKLASEHLCRLYGANWGVPTVALRYFTVYGPRQRPDMAMHRMVEAGLGGPPFPVYGTGEQVRDFTFVGDVVAANLAAATADVVPGTVVNVAGGGAISVRDLIELAGELLGSPVPVEQREAQPGDVERTGGSIDRARQVLGWAPAVDVRVGLKSQIDWHLARR